MKIPLKIFIIVVMISTQATAQDFWEKVNVPDSLVGIYALDFNSDNDIFAFAVDSSGWASRNLFHSTDNGVNWNKILDFWDDNPNFYAEIIVNISDIFFAYSSGIAGAGGPVPWEPNYLYQSLDNGNTWNLEWTEFSGSVDIAISPSGNVYCCIWDSLYRWNESEEDWTALSHGIRCQGHCLAVNSKDELFVFQDFFGDSIEILRSTDNGISWNYITAYINEFGPDYIPCVILKCSPHDDLFLRIFNKVYKSSNNDEDWNLLSEGLSDSMITCLAINTTGDVFAGTKGDGVYHLKHNSESWTKVISGLTHLHINCLAFDYNGIIYAGTGGEFYSWPHFEEECGLFRSTSSTTGIVEESELVIPVNYTLIQNYPNPFNPSTKIKFQIPNSIFTTLKVYNLLGEEVATLVSGKLNPGNHTYTFDGKNLASGIYYYQLVAGDFRQVKKMILLR